MNQKVRICSIASGSNGNAYYIEYGTEAILIDAGIGIRKFTKRTKERGIDPKAIHSIFISHEHSDHVHGLSSIANLTGADSYMTAGTARKTKPYYMPRNKVRLIEAQSLTEVGSFRVHSFPKPHDVEEPCSFRVEVGGLSIGVFTDIGCVCEGLLTHLAQCHVAFLESNYDEKMLWEGPYPEVLKKRVASDVGHLSNAQAAQIVVDAQAGHLHTLMLARLSGGRTRPRIARTAFERLADRLKVYSTSRYEAGELVEVTPTECLFPEQQIVIPERLDRAEIHI